MKYIFLILYTNFMPITGFSAVNTFASYFNQLQINGLIEQGVRSGLLCNIMQTSPPAGRFQAWSIIPEKSILNNSNRDRIDSPKKTVIELDIRLLHKDCEGNS